MARHFFSSESVTEGHPDKVCDCVSDAVLDKILEQDKNAHVACETTVTTGMVHIMGEISTTANVDIASVARDVIKEIGYDNPACGFDGNSCAVLVSMDAQSPDIAMGVNESYERKDGEQDEDNRIGAGDQGIMFGYACDETEELMPLPISLAHKLAKKLTEVRKNGTLSYLRPDGKTQVTVEYDDDTAVRVDTVVVSTQHDEDVTLEQIREDMIQYVIRPVIPEALLDADTKIFVNPTGRFVIGGPVGDAGLTGRKIIVDTYGGFSRHGGGAFSGKDPTKVDRSAAYYARYIAKNIVAAKLARRCEIQLAYAIGVAKPVSIRVDTFGTSGYSEKQLASAVAKVFDCRPNSIIRQLGLTETKYISAERTSASAGKKPTKPKRSRRRCNKKGADSFESALIFVILILRRCVRRCDVRDLDPEYIIVAQYCLRIERRACHFGNGGDGSLQGGLCTQIPLTVAHGMHRIGVVSVSHLRRIANLNLRVDLRIADGDINIKQSAFNNRDDAVLTADSLPKSRGSSKAESGFKPALLELRADCVENHRNVDSFARVIESVSIRFVCLKCHLAAPFVDGRKFQNRISKK